MHYAALYGEQEMAAVNGGDDAVYFALACFLSFIRFKLVPLACFDHAKGATEQSCNFEFV